MEKEVCDYSDISKEYIKDICMVESRNCLSIGRMLLLLGGSQSQYEFLSDAQLAHSVFEKAKQDIIDLALKHTVLFIKSVDLDNIQAICHVVYYKKSKLQRPRLVIAAAIKIEHQGKTDKFGNLYTFVRTYHIPCKTFS